MLLVATAPPVHAVKNTTPAYRLHDLSRRLRQLTLILGLKLAEQFSNISDYD